LLILAAHINIPTWRIQCCMMRYTISTWDYQSFYMITYTRHIYRWNNYFIGFVSNSIPQTSLTSGTITTQHSPIQDYTHKVYLHMGIDSTGKYTRCLTTYEYPCIHLPKIANNSIISTKYLAINNLYRTTDIYLCIHRIVNRKIILM
jgi:hypothetical protein